MRVDAAGRDHAALRVDLAHAAAQAGAQLHDAAGADADVGVEGVAGGGDAGVAYQQVEGGVAHRVAPVAGLSPL